MQDTLRERYDLVAYRHGSIPFSHPARIGLIGRLHGIAAAAPDRCRVLELGCAEGMNLVPLAERFPQSEFVGVDISKAQIETAEKARESCGLPNARFVCADLLEFEPEPDGFDYVIAHGVYSWVSDAVKDRLLNLCTRALKPNGVAYVSYNTMPGWGLLSGLREFLLAESARESDPVAQLTHARRVIATMNESLAGQTNAYAELLRQALTDMQQKSPALLYHDELALVNDPVTFTTFVEHAAAHSLQFVAEAHYASMPYEHLPVAMRSSLEALNLDFMRQQQFMDVLFQRWLRSSILHRSPAPVSREVHLPAIADAAIGLRLRLADPQLNLAPGAPLRLIGENIPALDFTDPAEKALLAVLAKAAPNRIPFPAALETTNRLLAQVKLPPIEDPSSLYPILYRLFTMDGVDLVLTGESKWLRTSTPPAPSPLMRYQAKHDLPIVNRWHEIVTVTDDGLNWLKTQDAAPTEAAACAGLLV